MLFPLRQPLRLIIVVGQTRLDTKTKGGNSRIARSAGSASRGTLEEEEHVNAIT